MLLALGVLWWIKTHIKFKLKLIALPKPLYLVGPLAQGIQKIQTSVWIACSGTYREGP